jgi:hypothetical protein
MKEKTKFSVTNKYEPIVGLVKETDKKTLAIWAIDCVERVIPNFKEKYPEDNRPRKAIDALQEWIDTGVFRMKYIRKAALLSHAAAREAGENTAACSTARAAGHAVATAHVPTHSIGAANYALQAIYRTKNPSERDAAIDKERDWQYKHLLKLKNEFDQ